jgi:hypothetical protein
MAYLYRHIRLDKNEPFYIGIGSDNDYKRAYKKQGRSFRWKDIAYKVQYEVEILLDGLTWEQACEKEIEFISLYGRADLNKGTLVNMTEGGEGTYGFKHTEHNVQKLKNRLKGNQYNLGTKYSDNTKKYLSNIRIGKPQINIRKPIFCINNKIIYDSVSIAANQLNLKQGDISNVLTNRQKSTKGFIFEYANNRRSNK